MCSDTTAGWNQAEFLYLLRSDNLVFQVRIDFSESWLKKTSEYVYDSIINYLVQYRLRQAIITDQYCGHSNKQQPAVEVHRILTASHKLNTTQCTHQHTGNVNILTHFNFLAITQCSIFILYYCKYTCIGFCT